MDGVQELQGVTIIAATNRPEVIVRTDASVHKRVLKSLAQDSALMRPGRFDRTLYVGPPDQAGREEILKIRMRTMTVDPDIDVADIARLVSSVKLPYIDLDLVLRHLQSEGCSGAEITALCQEAAILTMQKDMNAIFVSCGINSTVILYAKFFLRSLKKHLLLHLVR